MANAQIYRTPKEILCLPDGFVSMTKRVNETAESIVTVFGRTSRRPLPEQERVGDCVQMRKDVRRRAVGCQDGLRKESCGKVQAEDMEHRRGILRRWPYENNDERSEISDPSRFAIGGKESPNGALEPGGARRRRQGHRHFLLIQPAEEIGRHGPSGFPFPPARPGGFLP